MTVQAVLIRAGYLACEEVFVDLVAELSRESEQICRQ